RDDSRATEKQEKWAKVSSGLLRALAFTSLDLRTAGVPAARRFAKEWLAVMDQSSDWSMSKRGKRENPRKDVKASLRVLLGDMPRRLFYAALDDLGDDYAEGYQKAVYKK